MFYIFLYKDLLMKLQEKLYLAHAKKIFAYPSEVKDFIQTKQPLFVHLFSQLLEEAGMRQDVKESPIDTPWIFIASAAAKLTKEKDFLEVADVSLLLHRKFP